MGRAAGPAAGVRRCGGRSSKRDREAGHRHGLLWRACREVPTNRAAWSASSRIRTDRPDTVRDSPADRPRDAARNVEKSWIFPSNHVHADASGVRSSERTGLSALGKLSRRVFQRVSSAGYMVCRIRFVVQWFDRVFRIPFCAMVHPTLRGGVSESAWGRRVGVSESARSRIGLGADSGLTRWITGTERADPGVSDSARVEPGAVARMQLCAGGLLCRPHTLPGEAWIAGTSRTGPGSRWPNRGMAGSGRPPVRRREPRLTRAEGR